jgi:3-hydroxyisobutyrate dehydrogenase
VTRVGFVGLGSQGAPMARRIVDAGFPTTLWARRPVSLEPFAGTMAATAATPAELGAASDVLCVCVVDDAGVDEVLRGPDGALAAMADGSIVIVHSTVHPATCLRLQQDYPALSILDAPVSGGGHKATAGELLVMVGGPADIVERCRPILEASGDPVLHIGPLGAGQEAKVLNNAVFTAQLALAAEAFELATARQLDHRAVATILASGSGRSYAAEVVAGGGFNLDALAPAAGPLLAKDVGILADHTALTGSTLLATADAALTQMGVSRIRRDQDPAMPTGDLLSIRDRRFVTVVCASAAVDVPAMDAHVFAALASGDLTIEQMNECTLHFAVYCGWPRASQLEMTVRAQWERLHHERGEPVPELGQLGVEDLGPADPAQRIADGIKCFEEVNLIQAPSQDSPYFFAGILNFVFGHLWLRPGLTRRERRLITIPCVGVSDAIGPIWSHVNSALGSGDISYDEMRELILHFRTYAGTPRARVLEDVAAQWQAGQL